MSAVVEKFSVSTVAGGVRIVGYGGGKSSGSKSSTPTEAPDSLHSIAYARVLDLISEGDIYGPTHGLAAGLRDVYLDGTPVANADGTVNFQNVTIDFRTGTQTQDPIPGFPSSESTDPVGVELTQITPVTRAINNLDLSAVRVTLYVNGLSQADTSNGDIKGYRVDYNIQISTDGGAFQTMVTAAFDGKTTQRYSRSHRIDLPRAMLGWQVRISRTTPNQNSSTIVDQTFVDSITEVIDAKLRYPNSAIVGIQIDASQFSSVPSRAYDMRGIICRVPSNYDTETRIYTGIWDGTFQNAWTDNPAWIFFDLATNSRYGLGDRIPADWVDKWSLYAIGQYCDELVPDGLGGQEPRFTCNAYIQSAADAFKVLQDFASVFRGIVYYAGGTVVPVADMPRDPAYTYTGANVVNGKFTYVGSARSTRYTVALVSWNDLTDMGKAKVEPVQDFPGIARYGIRQTSVTAFGCTSQGQAQRVGKWLLLTSRLETRSVTFSVGLDGALAMPGQLIRVADANIAGRRIGGRISSATATEITVDAPVDAAAGDQITIILPSGVSETRTLSDAIGIPLRADSTVYTADSIILSADMTGLPGTVSVLTVTEAFSELPQAESVWTLEQYDLVAQTFRVISVKEGEGLTFDISAVQNVGAKYANIDNGTKISLPPITIIPPSVQPPPASVSVSEYAVIRQGLSSQTAVFSWPATEHAVSFEVQWRRDNSEWITAGTTGSLSLEIANIYAGGYTARVRALNALNVPSVWATSMLTQLDGILGPPPVVTSLVATSLVFGIQIDWQFPAGPSIIDKTEVWYSRTPSFTDATKLADFAYPQNTHTVMGLSAGFELYFWARLVDKNGVQGDFYPIGAGVHGESSSDANVILEYLAGQISETQLAQALIAKIDSGGDSAVAVEALTNALAAMYTIKTQLTVDGKPYMAGIGVGVENDDDIITSQILLSAQRVAVINETTQGISAPFVIQNGQVFMNQAFIASASIGSAKLADWIQSDALNSLGQPVLAMNFRTGEIQLNGPTNAGGRMTLNNNVLQVFDANNVLRVRLGLF